MFKELAEIIKTTNLSIAVSTDGDQIKLLIIPIPVAGSNPALSKSFELVGTPEELDNDLAQTLTGWSASYKKMKDSLAEIEAFNEAATKVAQEAATKAASSAQKATPTPAPAKTSASAPVVTVDVHDSDEEEEVELDLFG